MKLSDSSKELKQLIQPEIHTPESERHAKLLMNMVLQTPDQLRRGFEDIVSHAVQEKVECKEQCLVRTQLNRYGSDGQTQGSSERCNET